MQVSQSAKETSPYTALAAGYDMVMAHVDYEAWASHIHGLLQQHHPETQSILELGCGTGSLALALQPQGPYHYTATDGSAEMIRVAGRKAEIAERPLQFAVVDFTNFRVEEPIDALVLLYDGINYLLKEEAVQTLLGSAFKALRPGGVFLFDQSTPANSINNEAFFEDEGHARNFSYVRRSHYDKDACLHRTMFELTVGKEHFHEQHVQRAYTRGEIRTIVTSSAFVEVAAYDDFSYNAATDTSERIHWVLRRPEG